MRLLAKFWQNFKTQPDIWFFYGFLLTFTLSVRKVLYYYPVSSSFNEYTGIYLYLSDIFLILTLFFWLLSILRNKQRLLSSSSTLLPLLLAVWAFISIIWSENHWIATFRSIKLLEFYFLFLYISQRIFHSGLSKYFLIISFVGLIQAIIGIIQVFLQHSFGLFWLKESLISPDMSSVAKIVLDGEKYIRAYGLFPHPNILGGFLVFSIIITIYLLKSASSTSTTSSGLRPPSPCKGEGFPIPLSLPRRQAGLVRRGVSGKVGMRFLTNSLGIQIIGLILTFSKSAILGLLIALAYLAYKKCFTLARQRNVPRGTFLGGWNIFGQFGMKHFKRNILLALICLALIAVIVKPDFYSFFQKSLKERMIYLNVPRGTFITNPLAGIGNGQFVLEMQKYIPQKLETWQFQPVHNVFLLILSESGLVGLGLFVWFLWKMFSASASTSPFIPLLGKEREKEKPSPLQGEGARRADEVVFFRSILLAFIFIMLFDHYLWDIQQGQILLWLSFGLIAGDNNSLVDKW